MSEWVWAVDETGCPCKCFAKPENRGKGSCKHMFHAMPGEDASSFFKKLGVDPDQEPEVIEEEPEYTVEDLPDQKKFMKELIHTPDTSANEGFSDSVKRMIENNRFCTYNKAFIGYDVDVSEEVVDDETVVTLKFTDQETGEEQETSFSIPRMNEYGEIEINGTGYRFIPTLDDSPRMGYVGMKNCVILKDDDYGIVTLNRDGSDAVVHWNKNEKFQVSPDDIEKYLKGEDVELDDKVKIKLDSLHPIVKKKVLDEGIDSLLDTPFDDENNLDGRKVYTYNDRVSYTISKKIVSMDSSLNKARKNGKHYEFNMESLNDNIKKDLVNASYMQVSDNINPIAAMSQAQRVSWVGPGSYDAGDYNDPGVRKVRNIHESYYEVVDPCDVSLGYKVGLTMAVKGDIKNGTIHKTDCLSGSDFVPYLEHCDPNRTSMAINQMREACPIVGGEDPKVSTKGWDKIKGAKLGVNLTTAYIPEAGVWEDAVVISESAAKKMTTVQTKKYSLKSVPSNLKVGQEIHRGARLGGTEIRYPGKIKSIDGNNVVIESVYTMGVGDKIAGRSGNKGVVSKIKPDSEMPLVDGKRADIIMSPIGVAGRSNLGQIYEVNDGDFNKKSKIEYGGYTTYGTGGDQYIMRINQISEKKMLSNANGMTAEKRYKTRLGEMEQMLLSSNEDRLDILHYLKNQEYSDANRKLDSTLKSIGVKMRPAK